jgi:hypothetical protein
LVARTNTRDEEDGLKATCLQNSKQRTLANPVQQVQSVKYLVTFRKRFSPEGEPSDDPKSLVDPGDGVIQDAEFVEIIEPQGLGVAGDLNEGTGSQESNDNGFLAFGSESWIFTVADGREKDFKDALVESRVVLDYEEVPDESLTT